MLYEKLLPCVPEGGGGTPVDPNFNQVALLLHGDGTNGAQNNTFLDSSTNNFTVTRTGNVAQGTFSPFSLAAGQWSNYFDGTGDYLEPPDSTSYAPSTGDFTVEFWMYPTSANTLEAPFSYGNATATGIVIRRNGASTLEIYIRGTLVYTGSNYVINTWSHVAVSRSGTDLRIFVNGIQLGSTITNSADINPVAQGYLNKIRIGCGLTASSTPQWYFTGYISNVRYVVGTAVYTSNFTPSTTPLTAISGTSLLTCQSNRFIDNSSNNFTITRNGDTKVTAFSPFAPSAAYSASTNGGSGYFDGSGDRLQVADTSSLDLNGSAFNVEYWIYPLASPTTITVTGKMSGFTANPTAGWSMWLSSMRPTFGINGVFNSLIAPVANAIRVGEWSHIAASSDGSTYTNLYVNGVRVATTSSLLTNNTSLPMVIGSNINGTTWNNDYPVTGYIQDLRVVKGTAIYTGTTYTVPTAPLTAVANTQLLLNYINAGIIDNAGKNDIETVGNAQISTSVKKYGTGSMAFDGTGDYLTIPNSSVFNLSTGDFTVEMWFYSNIANSNYQRIYGCNTGSGTSNESVFFEISSSGLTVGCYSGSTAYRAFTNVALSANQWYHLALVRNGTTLAGYINGAATGSTTLTGSINNPTGAFPQIGAWQASGSYSRFINGYIDDLRITKGIARYTANFTPPTQAFPNL